MVQDNDDIIELTNLVEEGSSQEENQEIIELTDMAPPGEADQSEADELGLESQGPDALEPAVSEMADVRQADIEAALERVIEKKFSQTIETILFEVMERVIKKEIVDIKAGLQKDLDDIDRS